MKNYKGQVLVETAIILPLLLLLIFGLFDYARAMYTKNSLTNAARAGARAASVTASTQLPVETGVSLSSSSSAVGAAIKNSLYNGIPADSVTYDVALLDANGVPITGTVTAGNVVQVTVTYGSFSMITPFYRIAAIITNSAAAGSSTLTLSGQASMRYEAS